MKVDHLRKFNFLALPKFGKYQKTNKTILNHFPLVWSYGCITHHSPGMNRKIWGTRLILRPSPEYCGFCVSLVRWTTKTLRIGPTSQFTRSKTHNSVLLSSLSNSVSRHKGNVLLLRNIIWYSLPVPSVCYLLNQTYISTANLKFSTRPTYKIQVTQIKSP
jgi:hypothetical protein